MGVVAKFNVHEVAASIHSTRINMGVVTGDTGDDKITRDENTKFWDATPQGKIEIVITNPPAAEQFQAGDEFYVTFEKAEKPDAS